MSIKAKVENFRSFFSVDKDVVSMKMFLLLATVVWLFAAGVRLTWIYQVKDIEQFRWNDQIIINNADGFYYAEGARDILAGEHQDNDGSPVYSYVSKLTAFLVKILPFELETVILYVPIFFGSLLAIPIMLIGRALRLTWFGFSAALLGSIAYSYYNRTMAGYYDTDMLTVVLPMFLLCMTIYGIKHKKNAYLLFTAVALIVYTKWYSGGYVVVLAMIIILTAYTFIFERKDKYTYMMLFVLVGFFLLSVFLLKFRFDAILYYLNSYVFRNNTVTVSETDTLLHFFSVKQTVQEAGVVSFPVFANRISGHIVIFILSTIGYFFMAIRYPIVLIGLPIMGLGFLALKAGLRFTIYAVPINALGMGYITFLIAKWFGKFFPKKRFEKHAKIAIVTLITIGVLYPNLIHIFNYRKGVVVTKNEVASLDNLRKTANRDDYVISWWDYGYPIRYYSDTKTLGDGGKQGGDTNFPLSFILTRPQIPAANMAKIAVEFRSNILAAMKTYGYSDSNEFVKVLYNKNLVLPKSGQDIYIYLPYRILQNKIFPTILAFSNLDLMTGRYYRRPFFYQAEEFKETKDYIRIGKDFVIFKKDGVIKKGEQGNLLNSFISVGYDKDGKLRKKVTEFNDSSGIYAIYMQSYKHCLIMNKEIYDSLYIQLFVLENYDKELFEPVILDPWTKIYRLKKLI